MNIVIDFLGLFALTVLEQLHPQSVVENGIGEYQVEKADRGRPRPPVFTGPN
jgi:hypothetical protein